MSDRWTTASTAAPAYAALELATFPLHPILPGGRCGCGDRCCDDVGKHPATSGWQRSIASVQATGRIWRPGGRERGIGLACGPRSGCFVVDVDPRHGGDRSLAELVDRHGRLPRTWVAQSGRGDGLHIFFAWPEDIEIRNSTGKIGPGVDVRGAGGFVVLPPSPHASGGRYRWLGPPDALDLAPAPRWLLELAQEVSRPRRGGARAPAPMISAGGRHDALVSLLGLLKRWEACEEVGHAAAEAFVTHQCLDDDPSRPISMAHVHDQVRDVWRRYQ